MATPQAGSSRAGYLLLIVLAAAVRVGGAAEPAIPAATRQAFSALVTHPPVRQGLEFLKADEAITLADQKTMVVIAAPPFHENKRAAHYRARLAALGLSNARIDSEGNVIAVRAGTGTGPTLVVDAHLDTVFPPDTDLTIKERDGRLYAPGIADDTRGLAVLLSLVRALNATGIRTIGDIVFVGSVGEEGLGDLRGMKALYRDHRDIDGMVAVDGVDATRIMYGATGSHRYRVTFTGPGGHSFGKFGEPSAIHAMGRAIAKVGDIRPPSTPKTTFTVGTVKGGTSVNAIAADAQMEIDLRSNEHVPLLQLEKQVLAAIGEAVAEENARWGSSAIVVDISLVGDRPAGTQPLDSPVLQATWLANGAVGLKQILADPGSTNSNIPISLGIPGVTLGGGGASDGAHTLGEWYDPRDGFLGAQKIFLTVLGLVGVDGVAAPILPKRRPQ